METAPVTEHGCHGSLVQPNFSYNHLHDCVCLMHSHQETSPLSAIHRTSCHQDSLSMGQVANKMCPQLG
uniref:Uncharacterized protein n=1 Tax=Arundo donax TaxID=35708 RepID=A0A0A9G490_ARUDO